MVAFAFRPGKSLDEEARRVAHKQLRKALDALDQPEVDVHDVRKRTKRVRAVARLVRSGIGDGYQPVNTAARDAARALAPARDGEVLADTFRSLGLTPPLNLIATGKADVDQAREHLSAAREAVDDWSFGHDLDVLADGLHTTYRRGRRALAAARAEPTAAAFHEWRKATKYLWHQTQLLAPAAPELLKAQARALHDLADLLGDDHDLAVLVDVTRDEEAKRLAEDRRAELEQEALPLGSHLYVEKPKAFVTRMTGLWTA